MVVRRVKAKCTNCPAEMQLGADGENIGDTAYKLLCPVLREHFRNNADADCPYMHAVKAAAEMQRKRRRQAPELRAGRKGKASENRSPEG